MDEFIKEVNEILYRGVETADERTKNVLLTKAKIKSQKGYNIN